MKLIYPALALSMTMLAPSGCTEAHTEFSETPPAAEAAMAIGTVDSIFPIEEEIRRFKLAVGDEATELVGGASSRDELVTNFITALERSDTAAIGAAAMTPAEFIDLYFPHTVYTRPPYEADPAFIWFQMQNHGSRGLSRAYDRFAGREIGFVGYTCPDKARIEGPNRIWEGCRVKIGSGVGEAELRLFGQIIERDGQFKFVSYGNEL